MQMYIAVVLAAAVNTTCDADGATWWRLDLGGYEPFQTFIKPIQEQL